jgi:hypothetical protein
MENRNLLRIEQLFLPLAVVALGAILRLVPHPANVAPIAAIALFGGAYLPKRYAFVLPILAMVISDLFLGFSASTPLVYLSFLITGLIGLKIRDHKTPLVVLGSSLLSSVIFFLLTNFNFWYATSLYPKTIAGMIEAYTMAIPFFRNTVLGDLFYTAVFFGGFEIVRNLIDRKVYGRAYLHKTRG